MVNTSYTENSSDIRTYHYVNKHLILIKTEVH